MFKFGRSRYQSFCQSIKLSEHDYSALTSEAAKTESFRIFLVGAIFRRNSLSSPGNNDKNEI